MKRDYGIEIEHLKKELGDIKEMLTKKPAPIPAPAPAKPVEPGKCTFCGKENVDVSHFITGPGVNICNVCVEVCEEVLSEDTASQIKDNTEHASGTSFAFATTHRTEVYCSFCGKSQNHVEKIIAGPNDATICDCCVALSRSIISDNPNKKNITFVPPAFQYSDPRLKELMQELLRTTYKAKRTGSFTCFGMFESSGRASQWISDRMSTDELLSLIENKTAALVLQSIGNNDRLNVLLAILKSPMNVATIVEVCGFNSSGQVYHHLRPLIAADLVYEPEHGERGVYAIVPYRVQGIVTVLAGISFLVDTKYKAGDWAHDSAADDK